MNEFTIFNIELTNHCLMKCVMCPRTRNMTRPLGYMDFGLFRKAIDEMLECNPSGYESNTLWLHHFGESLMHPDFAGFIRYASGKNIRTGLSINPVMLTDRIADELISSKPQVIYISLDGHDDETFCAIRGMKNSYGKSKERLMRFIGKKNDSGATITLILSMIDFNLNHESIERSRSLWESVRGIDQFLIKSFTTWDGSAPDVNSYAERGAALPADRSAVQCSWPFERMTITWDGDVVPCCFDYDKKYVLGNIGSSTLSRIWTGEPMERLREEFRSNRVANPLCVNCGRLYMPKERIEL